MLPPGLAEHPDYRIIRELGRGGMGVVYLAHNQLMGRDEVLKVMGRHVIEKPGVLERFQREIRAVAKLRHPNIVAAYTAFRLGDGIVFAMEYVDGHDLSMLVRSKGPLSVAHASNFVYQAALGLQHAHEEGMVHRDIKPGNLMLSRKGDRPLVKILDFGLAKASREGTVDTALTREGQMLGTPDYIAPEQTLDPQKADIRADIYSLGCTLYYLLKGGPPFQGSSLFEVLQAHHATEATALDQVRPDIPKELAAVVARMMAKSPADRYRTPAEAARALAPFFKSGKTVAPATPQPVLPVAPVPPVNEPELDIRPDLEESLASSTSPWQARRWLWPAAAAASVLLLVLISTLAASVLRPRSPDVPIARTETSSPSSVVAESEPAAAKTAASEIPPAETPLEDQTEAIAKSPQVPAPREIEPGAPLAAAMEDEAPKAKRQDASSKLLARRTPLFAPNGMALATKKKAAPPPPPEPLEETVAPKPAKAAMVSAPKGSTYDLLKRAHKLLKDMRFDQARKKEIRARSLLGLETAAKMLDRGGRPMLELNTVANLVAQLEDATENPQNREKLKEADEAVKTAITKVRLAAPVRPRAGLPRAKGRAASSTP
jgi:serine/threonine protein kinase